MAMDQSIRASEIGVPPLPGAPGEDFEVSLVSLNQRQIAFRRFRRHKLAVFGTLLFLAICAIAVVGPFIIPFNFYDVPAPIAHCPGDPKSLGSSGCPPSLEHPFGTTGGLGRDVLSVVVNGARLSLVIGVGASVFAAVIGAIV